MRGVEMQVAPTLVHDIAEERHRQNGDARRCNKHEQHRSYGVHRLTNTKEHHKPRKGERQHKHRVVQRGGFSRFGREVIDVGKRGLIDDVQRQNAERHGERPG